MKEQISTRSHAAPAASLRKQLAAVGIAEAGAEWHPYRGGRTNRIWRVGSGAGALVCKLYLPDAASPLFPNDANAEWRALGALSGTGLAPEPVTLLDSDDGPCLIYRNIEGEPVGNQTGAVAARLAQLHRHSPPAGLRKLIGGAAQLRRQALAMLDDCRSSGARALRKLCPATDLPPAGKAVFLHGDLVPANVLSGRAGLAFIDWQCPAAGDPAEDIAIFMSPAMRSLYGAAPLTPEDCDAFLRAYGNAEVTRRYYLLAPLFHWRMAAHCLWKAERGAPDYQAALKLECAALEKLGQQDQRDAGTESQRDQAE